MSIYKKVDEALQAIADAEKISVLKSFFKTDPGEYGAGDKFIGIKVPENRKVAKEYYIEMTKDDYEKLIQSPIHEYRLCALFMLIHQYEKSKNSAVKEELIDWYLQNLSGVNNWDLVDSSCYKLLGRHAYDKGDCSSLRRLAVSDDMWHKRIAVVGTMYFVKKKSYDLTIELILLNMTHPHDLMHKANGWLLREIGEQDENTLLHFLDHHATLLPRTSLRYAIEKLPEDKRQYYLKLK